MTNDVEQHLIHINPGGVRARIISIIPGNAPHRLPATVERLWLVEGALREQPGPAIARAIASVNGWRLLHHTLHRNRVHEAIFSIRGGAKEQIFYRIEPQRHPSKRP